MNELFLTFIILGHIFGDAILQSREMGEKKSSHFPTLLNHILRLSSVTLAISVWFLSPLQALGFTLFNGIAHAIIDGSIWNIYKFKVRLQAQKDYDSIFTSRTKRPFNEYLQEVFIPKFEYWKDKDFYTFIIVDQMLHILCFIWLLRLLS